MFKISVIGCGQIAMSFHGPAIKKYATENPDTVLLSCCDSDINRAKEFAETFGFQAHYGDYKEMLRNSRPDAVCLITSYTVIPAIAIDVINEKLPIIMEKPPGVTGAEVSSIINAAQKNGTLNQVAFNRRFTPIVSELKSIITQSGASDIHNIRCVFQRVNRTDNDFYTTAIHGIDTTGYIAGSGFKHVRFRYQELTEINEGAANIFLDCEMESGAVAQFSICTNGGKVIEDYIVTCRNNDYTLKMPVWGSPEYPGGLWHFSENKCVNHIPGDDPRFGEEMFERFGFYSENADFFDDVKANRMPANDITTALQSVEIARCIQERKKEWRI